LAAGLNRGGSHDHLHFDRKRRGRIEELRKRKWWEGKQGTGVQRREAELRGGMGNEGTQIP